MVNAPAAPSVLFLIAARGGSKGIPGKNLRQVAGLTLVGFKARAAQKCSACTRLIISTDSAEIQSEAKRLGVEVPFTRPAELATDTATSESVLAHAIAWIEENERRSYDAIMLLEPASPFATDAHLTAAIDLYTARSADLVVGMRATDPASMFIGPQSESGSIANIVGGLNNVASRRRQDQQSEWTMNGALYLVGWEALKEGGKVYGTPEKCFGLLMDRWHSLEIETPEDLALAEFAAGKGYLDLSPWKE
jgi:CMP-N,N'-diacetyllegionaminic acid synthase